jgi:hypothetical protein
MDMRMAAGGGEFAGVSGVGDGWLAAFETVCHAAVRTLPVRGAWVSQMSSGGFGGLVCASDEMAVRLDELQFALGEGPSMTAFAESHPVLANDLDMRGSVARWPMFADAAVGAGARAVFALPLCIGAIGLGVLAMYRVDPGTLLPDELSSALRLADLCAYALLDLVTKDALPELITADGNGGTPLDRPVEFHRAVVHQASGVLVVQLDVSIEEALARLRAYAFAEELPIGDVAEAIVARSLRLER